MTLIMAAHVGRSFCLTTGDTLTAYYEYTENPETGELEDGKLTSSIKGDKKVVFITDFVTWGAAGKKEIITHIRQELLNRVTPDMDLNHCRDVLEIIIQEMRKQENPPYCFRFLDQEDEFGIILNGFNKDGSGGFAYYIAGDNEQVVYRAVKPYHDDCMMWAPSSDYAEKKDELMDIDIQPTKKGMQDVINRFLKIHAIISFLEPESVSEIFEYKTMKWKFNAEKTKEMEDSIDVSKHYKKLGFYS